MQNVNLSVGGKKLNQFCLDQILIIWLSCIVIWG